jgi:hypothetical protein
MRPLLSVSGAQLFLLSCQVVPVMERVRLLHHADIQHSLALAFPFLHFAQFSQPAAKIVDAVAQVEFRLNVDDVSLAQPGHAPGIAFGLDLAEACLTGASSFGSREETIGFRATMFLRHDFQFGNLWQFRRFWQFLDLFQHGRRHQLLFNMPFNALGQEAAKISATAARPVVAFQPGQRRAKHFRRVCP